MSPLSQDAAFASGGSRPTTAVQIRHCERLLLTKAADGTFASEHPGIRKSSKRNLRTPLRAVMNTIPITATYLTAVAISLQFRPTIFVFEFATRDLLTIAVLDGNHVNNGTAMRVGASRGTPLNESRAANLSQRNSARKALAHQKTTASSQ